jgi:hypothetical protein
LMATPVLDMPDL